MYELVVKNRSGEELNLSASKEYIVYKITGLNPPKATINTSSNATEDGVKINSSKIESRNIVLYISIKGDVEKSRINLYKYFTSKNNVTLYFKNGTRSVFIEGVVESNECDMFTQNEFAQVSIICPNPYFKSDTAFTSTFSEIESMFEFPFAIPSEGIAVSGISSNVRKNIEYEGDVPTGVVIEILATGTVVNPIIYNVHDRTQMALKFTMQASDKIVINTNFNQKSVMLVRNGVSTNALGYMLPNSTWFVLKNGDNVFTYDAESGESNLQIVFSTSILYGGV